MGKEERRRMAPLARLLAALLALGLLIAAAWAPSTGAIGFLDEWGGPGSGPGRFAFPASVAVDAGGTVYVADSENDRIQTFTEAGRHLGEWGASGSGPGELATPEAVAVDASGDVYVADKGNHRIEKFSATGAYLAEWGGEGSGPGQLEAPEDIALDAAGNLYVADAGNDRIEEFTPGGAPITRWGGSGTAAGRLNSPDGVDVGPAGAVYVADSGNDRVQKFTAGGAFLAKWGRTGDGPGEFDFPVAVATDAAGRVYVADSVNDRIEVFNGTGKLLSQWGASGRAPGQFDSPVAIAVGAAGRLFVADGGNNRIQVFGRLPRPRYGSSFNVGVVAGIVLVHLPGSTGFVRLGAGQQLPIGAIVNTNRGRVRLSSAKGPGGGTQSADFFSGTFRVLQPHRGRPITVLKLENPLVCPKTKHLRRTRNRGLWGSGKGNFRSRGRHGSATVRGTIWWAQDNCRGTLFRVKRGVVTIRDFTNHRKLKLRRGQRYLAPNG